MIRAEQIWNISIHALREEGDSTSISVAFAFLRFLSTPSARRATRLRSAMPLLLRDFYPRPPRGGRLFTPNRILWKN